MTKHLSLISLFILLLSCGKYHDFKVNGYLQGDAYLRGRLFLTDTFTQNITLKPVAGKIVYLSVSGSPDSLNYLYTDTTDHDGYFIFGNLLPNKLYRVRYQEAIKNGPIYFGDVENLKVPIDTLTLEANVNFGLQNGIQLHFTDATGVAPLYGVTTCIFANPALFNATDCNGSSFNLTTDSLGNSYKYNIKKGTYYALSKYTIGTSNYISKDTLVVGDLTIVKTIKMIPVSPIKVTYNLIDSAGTIVPNVEVCLFTSQVVYGTTSDCSKSNYSSVSNSKGVASFNSLDQGKYFVFAHYNIDSTRSLVGRDTLVMSTQNQNKTIKLAKNW